MRSDLNGGILFADRLGENCGFLAAGGGPRLSPLRPAPASRELRPRRRGKIRARSPAAGTPAGSAPGGRRAGESGRVWRENRGGARQLGPGWAEGVSLACGVVGEQGLCK